MSISAQHTHQQFFPLSPKQSVHLIPSGVPHTPLHTPSSLIMLLALLHTLGDMRKNSWINHGKIPSTPPQLCHTVSSRYTGAQPLFLSSVSNYMWPDAPEKASSKYSGMCVLMLVGKPRPQEITGEFPKHPQTHMYTKHLKANWYILPIKLKLFFLMYILLTTMLNTTSKSSKHFSEFMRALSHLFSQQTHIKIITNSSEGCTVKY